MDRSSTKPATKSKSASYIQSFLSKCGISDIWRLLHPSDRTLSFFSHAHHTNTRIDHFFVDDRIVPQISSCDYQTIVISDHAPLVMSVTFPGIPVPTRRWRFNSTLLSDDKFVTFMEEQISFFLDTNNTPGISALTVWDALKAYMRGQIISYTANIIGISQKEKSVLLSTIHDADKEYSQLQTPELYYKKVDLQTRFDLLSGYHTQNILLKNSSLLYEHGEKSGKLLANLLKGRRAKQVIAVIRSENGEIISNPPEINNIFRDFYSHLYTSEFDGDDSKISAFLNSLPIPSIPPDLMKKLEAPVTQAEIVQAISSMQSSGTPG